MPGIFSRRQAIAAGAVSTGALVGSLPSPVHAEPLPDVWGEDFLVQWKPPQKSELKFMGHDKPTGQVTLA